MQLKNRFLILFSLFVVSSAHAYEISIAPLYWRASEGVDWELSNNLNSANQNIAYRSYAFNYAPGIRVGMYWDKKTWNTEIYYTHFYTTTSDSAAGNLTSTFLGGKMTQSNTLNPSLNFFYQTGQASMTINYNIFDWNVGKNFHPTETLTLRPLIGLEGGGIYQTINSHFQGNVSVTENIKNNFLGLGPKAGIDANLVLFHSNNTAYSIVTNLATSYLWGRWNISDNLYANTGSTTNIHTSSRNFAALAFQGLLGFKFTRDNFAVKLSYEINDWLNQCQIFDDATGAHNNDLYLQGFTLSFSYAF